MGYKGETGGRTFRRRRRKRKLEGIFIRNNIDDKADSIDIKEQRIYHELQKWMGAEGFTFTKKLKPSHFKGTGRGLITKEAVLPGDLIISLPENLLITPQKVKITYLGPYLNRYCPNATGPEILSVFLMFEKLRGKASSWSPYINTLPVSYTIPACCNDEILSSLPYSLKFSILEQTKSIKNSFKNLTHVLLALEQTFPEFHGELNFQAYIWSWCSVNSRCIYMECQEDCIGNSCTYHLALAPFLDLLNHSASIKVKAGFNKQSKCYEIVSENLFKKHSQVFINYGNHSNRKLFLEYGFVLKNNINDIIPISIDEVLQVLKNMKTFNSMLKVQTVIQQNSFLCDNLGFCEEGMTWTLNVLLKIMSLHYNSRHWELVMEEDFQLKETENLQYLKLARELVLLTLQNYSHTFSVEFDKNNDVDSPKSMAYLPVVCELCSVEKGILIQILNALDENKNHLKA